MDQWQPSDEDLQRTIARKRDEQFADWIALAIGLAAKTHPDILRAAFKDVFDLEAMRETYKRAADATKEMVARMQKLREEEQILRDRITRAENRLDQLNNEIELFHQKKGQRR